MFKILAVLGVSLPLAFGQSGTVTSAGQPIPGVIVRATMGERLLTTATDETGAFQFTGMMPGTWSVEAEMFGFDPLKRDVTIGETAVKIDLTLQLQAREQVAARGPAGGGGRGGGRGGGGGNQNQQQDLVAEVPPEIPQQAPNGDASNSAFTIAGTVSTGLETNNNDFRGGGFGGPDFQPGGGGDFGQQGGQGNPGNGGGGGRGNRNNGGGGGGNFNGGGGNFQGGGGGGGRGGGGGGGRGGRGGQQQARGLIGNRSRQGANQIRINVFDTVTDSAFNAKSYSLNGQEQAKPQNNSNRFGINIGGPAIIPHVLDWSKQLNFTVNYNGTIANQFAGPFSTVPSGAEQGGDFAGATVGTGAKAIPVTIFDPLSGNTTPFMNNQIPLTRIDPIAMDLQKYIPTPTLLSTTTNNYQFATAQPNNAQQVTVQLQYTVRPADRVNIQIRTQATNATTAQNFGFLDKRSGLGQNQQVGWTHNFSQRLFNTLTVSLNRNRGTATPYFETLGQNIGAQLGIAGQWQDPSNYGPPSISFKNFTGLTDGYPNLTVSQTTSVQDSLSIRRGKHNLQFGANVNRQDNNLLLDSSGRGSFQFTGTSTAQIVNGSPVPNTGFDYADFLLGLPSQSSVVWGADRYYRGIIFGAFANDDFRVRSNVSLQLGLRYDYTTPFTEKYGREANLALSNAYNGIPGATTATVISPNCAGALLPCTPTPGVPAGLVDPQRTAIQPRVGLAWQAMKRGNLRINAGYGIYYNESVYTTLIGQLATQSPFLHNSGTVVSSPTNILTLADGLTEQKAGTTITNTTAYDPNYKDPYSQTWNLGFQRNLPDQLVLQVNYIGVKGTHLQVGLDPNQALPGLETTATSRFPIADANTFTYYETGANLISHSGTVSLQRRMRNNLGMQLSYTRAKSIDDTGSVLNPLCIRCERALSNNDQRDRVQFQFTAESPVDQRKGFLANKGFLTHALKDWTLQAPVTWATGQPRTATVSGDIAGIGTISGQRAEATGIGVNSCAGAFLCTNAFALPTPGTFGNAGNGTIPGPHTFSFNMNMSRTIQLKERKSLEIQINSTNILNHPVPSAFGTTVGSYNFGVISNVGQMRQISGTIRFRM